MDKVSIVMPNYNCGKFIKETIGAGAVVVKDIKKEGIYVGVPANKKA